MAQQRLQLTWYNKDKALIPSQEGRYDYTWVEPSDPRVREVHPLIFDEYVQGIRNPKNDKYEYSERADLTPSEDNLLILGESGEVLKALTRTPELAEKYVGKVKLVYIDPPFNTAQTFAHYEDNLEHSIWLSMMRDRLYMLKSLLSEDGSIWVHLDDSEVHRMRMLMDEVFTANNFVAELVWRKTYSPENRSAITRSHDFILVFAKNRETFKNNRNLLPRSLEQNTVYKNPDNDPRGLWRPDNFTAQAGHGTANQFYTLVTPAGNKFDPPPGRCWVYTNERYQELLADNRVYFGKNGQGRPNVKRFLAEVVQGRVPSTWLDYSEVGHSQDAKNEIQSLFPDYAPFSTPKPERLIERIIHIATNPGDLVVDVFAGSGTTAAVAQKMGRRWITCELLENTFNQFTKARLEKVVNDQDPGGITQTKGARIASADSPLPQGVSADDAAKFTYVLNKFVGNDPELAGSAKNNPLIKQLKQAAKTTRAKTILNWRGGGGFQVAHVAPACFTYNEELGITQFTDQAWGDVLKSSVVTNLGYSLLDPEDDSWFEGRRGNTLLKVYEGVLTTDIADGFLSYLEPHESLVIAAVALEDGVREYVRRARKGSRALHIRDELFPKNYM
ncbi:site-specific DNA-methyltransferase [Rothia dentocariosa]|uniref:site-specific DNA-methyltransferase n=1 Tax=Rothia dentocariosa TaxID=2047 RepID=UPI0028EFB031|nr:site-specific DNA-methyltransferase [Rothia dentocariosa]